MTTPTKTGTLQTYVSDVQALLGHGLQTIEHQVENLKGEGHEEAIKAVREFRQVLQGHHAALEARINTLGGPQRSTVKEAVSRVAGVAAGVINAARPEEASKSIRDDYTFLSHCAVAYLMLYTTALSLDDRETSELAERGYRDCARMIMMVDRIMPRLVLEELQQDKLPAIDVSEQVRTMVRDAWRREAVAAGVSA